MNPLFTIVILTYNRGYCINRALKSLEAQTVKAFHCLIIDDGSADNTEEVIKDFAKNAHFTIEYHYKEHGGVNAALNEAVKYIKTEFLVRLDSDDYFVKDAVEVITNTWDSLSEEQKKIYSNGIIALTRNSTDKKINGGKFPDNINEMSQKEYMKIVKRGERLDMQNVEYLRQYPLLTKNGLYFIPEATNRYEIFSRYRQFAINKTIKIYVINKKDSICWTKLNKRKIESSYYANIFMLNHYLPSRLYSVAEHMKLYVFTITWGLFCESYIKIIKKVKGIKNKIFCFICSPIALIQFLKHRKNYR